jgi:aarF domain-containing kinase
MSQYRRFRDLARVGHGALLVFERILSKPASHKIIKQNIAINSAPKLFPATNVKQQPKIQLSSTTPSASSRPSSAPDIPKIDAKSTIQQVQDEPSISPLSMRDTQLDLTRNRNMEITSDARERAVPSTRIGRMWHLGGLVASIGASVMGQRLKRSVGLSSESESEVTFFSESNAKKLADTLSRLRGAALKLGQMISIQDENLLPPQFAALLERMRQGADFMPLKQVEKVMVSAYGENWRDNFKEFNERPIAAASIGQVHKAVLKGGQEVAVKVQYPGVAKSIDSDLNNLASLLLFSNILPPGLFLEKTIEVAKKELGMETDYENEATNQMKYKELIANERSFYIPIVYNELTRKQVLVSEFVYGESFETICKETQEVRNWVAYKILELTFKELFELKFMQTDPNWSNFFFNPFKKEIVLLDFGGCRQFSTSFVDDYIRVIHGAIVGNDKEVLEASQRLGFLTGEEDAVMQKAHVGVARMLGTPFKKSPFPFDFANQNISKEVISLIPTMSQHRLAPPPEETYTLHRKLSGAFSICTKLKAKIHCSDIFWNIYNDYKFASGVK